LGVNHINGRLDPDGFPLSRIRSVTGYGNQSADSDFLAGNALGKGRTMPRQSEKQNEKNG
jgi:hypothetical protein